MGLPEAVVRDPRPWLEAIPDDEAEALRTMVAEKICADAWEKSQDLGQYILDTATRHLGLRQDLVEAVVGRKNEE